jgi:adenine deaminase
MQNGFHIQANLIDILDRQIYLAKLHIENGKITKIKNLGNEAQSQPYLLPGFIDAHIHIESSLLTPCQFARLAVVHGTVATVSDPHEIANVLEISGVEYMIDNGKQVNFKFFFGCPSCVPATKFETAGCEMDEVETDELMRRPDIYYLAEMMNFPGVLNRDEKVLKKILVARKYKKPIDGHAPGLRGENAKRYAAVGISTDHECVSIDEALDKLACSMKILIREGSAARNFDALIDLLPQHFEKLMFCSDDKHPDSLVESHINDLVKRAVAKGFDLFQVLRVACLNPVQHYRLPVGLLGENDPADFILIDNPQDFNVLQTFINGEKVAENGKSLLPHTASKIVNQFRTSPRQPEDFRIPAPETLQPVFIKVIEALDKQLITNALRFEAKIREGAIVADPERDLLKIAIVNRYKDAPVALGFVKNFGLKQGAMASSVAHDSHNVIAVGASDAALCQVVNLVIKNRGGLAVVRSGHEFVLPLPIAGLMSGEDAYTIAGQYANLEALVREMGSHLQAPFMTLSFMALLVIPSLKMSDLGLFDGEKFAFTPLIAQ